MFDLYLRTLGRWTFNRADVVCCYTETDKQRVQEYGVSSRIEVVSNGIDTERFTPEGPESELVDTEGPVVLFVGRLVEGKRPGDAVGAVDQVRETYPDVRLYVCGDGPLRSDLEAESTRRGIAEHVEFLGHVPYERVPEIYRSADVLVLPSRAEDVPRTVLEAMASGTPVVVSDLPQVRSIVATGGVTVEIGAREAFAEEVAQLLEDDAYREQAGTRGRDRIVSDHQWADTVDRTTAILEGLTTGTANSIL